MYLPLSYLVFFFILNISKCEELPVKYVSLRTVDSSGRTIPRPLLNQPNFKNYNVPIILKRDVPNKAILIQSDVKRMPSIKTASLDEFYSTKEFNDLLKEYKLNIDKNKLPDIRDVVSFLGTSNSEDTYNEIRDFASTEDGLDLIKSYFEQNSASDRMDWDIFNIQPKASMFHSDPDYKTNAENNENGSWWDKLIKWFGLSQSTKIDSAKNDVDIFSSVPISNSVPKNVKYIGSIFKPSPNTNIPINPPFKVFNSHSINLSNQPYTVDVKTLPTIRMTEHQYNEMMKSVNLNSQKLARNEAMRRAEDSFHNKEFIEDQFQPSEIKRSFSTQSQPMRHTSYDLQTGSHYKANPDYIDKISKILSEKLDDKRVVSAVSDLTVQQHSQVRS